MTARSAQTLQSLLLMALPAGGQATARRNAWAGMSADAARSRTRRDADAALERSLARHGRTAAAR